MTKHNNHQFYLKLAFILPEKRAGARIGLNIIVLMRIQSRGIDLDMF